MARLISAGFPWQGVAGKPQGAYGRGGTVIVWINGAFGAGKTSAARELIDLIPNSTLYDPEVIGGGLRAAAAARSGSPR